MPPTAAFIAAMSRAMLRETSAVSDTRSLASSTPAEAWAMLPATSRVTTACSSMAAAMLPTMPPTSRITVVICPISPTASPVEPWIPEIRTLMSSVAEAVCRASSLISPATTAKPLPADPARAASMVALSASRFVWAEMSLIASVTWPISCAAWPSFRICAVMVWASEAAFSLMARARALLAAMSPTVALICSVALATEERLPVDCFMPAAIDAVLALASSAAAATVCARSDIDAVPEAVSRETAESSVAALARVWTLVEIPPSSRRRLSVIV